MMEDRSGGKSAVDDEFNDPRVLPAGCKTRTPAVEVYVKIRPVEVHSSQQDDDPKQQEFCGGAAWPGGRGHQPRYTVVSTSPSRATPGSPLTTSRRDPGILQQDACAVVDAATGRVLFRTCAGFHAVEAVEGEGRRSTTVCMRVLQRTVREDEHVILAYGQTGSGKSHALFGEEIVNAAGRGGLLEDRFARRVLAAARERRRWSTGAPLRTTSGQESSDNMPPSQPGGRRLQMPSFQRHVLGKEVLGKAEIKGKNQNAVVDAGLLLSIARQLFRDEEEQERDDHGRSACDHGRSAGPVVPAVVQFEFLELYNDALRVLVPHTYAISVGEVESLAFAGFFRRRRRSTADNWCSSRSHALVTLVAGKRKITLVDLAGPERLVEGMSKAQLAETQSISRSLQSLRRVVGALSAIREDDDEMLEEEQEISARGGGPQHVPWRDSKLTQLLRPQAGRCPAFSVIVTLSPDHAWGSVQSLRFAESCRMMKLPAASVVAQQEREADRPLPFAGSHASSSGRGLRCGSVSPPRSQLNKGRAMAASSSSYYDSTSREREEYEAEIRHLKQKLALNSRKISELRGANAELRRETQLRSSARANDTTTTSVDEGNQGGRVDHHGDSPAGASQHGAGQPQPPRPTSYNVWSGSTTSYNVWSGEHVLRPGSSPETAPTRVAPLAAASNRPQQRPGTSPSNFAARHFGRLSTSPHDEQKENYCNAEPVDHFPLPRPVGGNDYNLNNINKQERSMNDSNTSTRCSSKESCSGSSSAPNAMSFAERVAVERSLQSRESERSDRSTATRSASTTASRPFGVSSCAGGRGTAGLTRRAPEERTISPLQRRSLSQQFFPSEPRRRKNCSRGASSPRSRSAGSRSRTPPHSRSRSPTPPQRSSTFSRSRPTLLASECTSASPARRKIAFCSPRSPFEPPRGHPQAVKPSAETSSFASINRRFCRSREWNSLSRNFANSCTPRNQTPASTRPARNQTPDEMAASVFGSVRANSRKLTRLNAWGAAAATQAYYHIQRMRNRPSGATATHQRREVVESTMENCSSAEKKGAGPDERLQRDDAACFRFRDAGVLLGAGKLGTDTSPSFPAPSNGFGSSVHYTEGSFLLTAPEQESSETRTRTICGPSITTVEAAAENRTAVDSTVESLGNVLVTSELELDGHGKKKMAEVSKTRSPPVQPPEIVQVASVFLRPPESPAKSGMKVVRTQFWKKFLDEASASLSLSQLDDQIEVSENIKTIKTGRTFSH